MYFGSYLIQTKSFASFLIFLACLTDFGNFRKFTFCLQFVSPCPCKTCNAGLYCNQQASISVNDVRDLPCFIFVVNHSLAVSLVDCDITIYPIIRLLILNCKTFKKHISCFVSFFIHFSAIALVLSDIAWTWNIYECNT